MTKRLWWLSKKQIVALNRALRWRAYSHYSHYKADDEAEKIIRKLIREGDERR